MHIFLRRTGPNRVRPSRTRFLAEVARDNEGGGGILDQRKVGSPQLVSQALTSTARSAQLEPMLPGRSEPESHVSWGARFPELGKLFFASGSEEDLPTAIVHSRERDREQLFHRAA